MKSNLNLSNEKKMRHYDERIAKHGMEDPRSARWPADHKYQWAAFLHSAVLLGVPGVQSVVDHGTGNGRTLRIFTNNNPNIRLVVGLDMNENFVQFCKKSNEDCSRLTFEKASSIDYLFAQPKDSVDWAISTGCLMGMINPSKTDEEVFHQLVKTSKVGFSVIIFPREHSLEPERFAGLADGYRSEFLGLHFSGKFLSKDAHARGMSGRCPLPTGCRMMYFCKTPIDSQDDMRLF